jgi:hypothetical protein
MLGKAYEMKGVAVDNILGSTVGMGTHKEQQKLK